MRLSCLHCLARLSASRRVVRFLQACCSPPTPEIRSLRTSRAQLAGLRLARDIQLSPLRALIMLSLGVAYHGLLYNAPTATTSAVADTMRANVPSS